MEQTLLALQEMMVLDTTLLYIYAKSTYHRLLSYFIIAGIFC